LQKKKAIKGLKFDQGKPAVALVPVEAILGAARGLTYGKNKYGADNFRAGIEYRRLVSSLMRHLLAWMNNEDIDEESQLHHIDLVLSNASMLRWMIENRPDLDDRWKPDKRR